GGQIAGLGRADGGERPLAVARQRRRHLRLHAGLDDHHFRALAESAHERGRAGAGHLEARGRYVLRLHRGGGVEHHDHLAGALPHHGRDRTRQRQGQREQRQELEQEQRIAVQALEERRRLTVAQRGAPEQEARHRSIAAADLQEVEQHQRDGQREQRQCKRSEEAHATTRPRSWARTNGSTGESEVMRWEPNSLVRPNGSTRSRYWRRRSRYARTASPSIESSRVWPVSLSIRRRSPASSGFISSGASTWTRCTSKRRSRSARTPAS